MEPPFPPEIWEQIFRHLTRQELSHLRLVCHRWNAIVMGSPSLRDQFTVLFRQAKLREGHTPANFPPVTRAQFYQTMIRAVDSWWPGFGHRLTTLFLTDSVVPAPMLVRMLRQCPNLKRLELCRVRILADGEIDCSFKLDKLEQLMVIGAAQFEADAKLIDTCWSVFPRLKILMLKDTKDWIRFDLKSMAKLIRKTQDTLQSLEFLGKFNLEQLCEMDRLQLKNARLNPENCDVELWIRFCRSQHALHDLKLSGLEVTNELACVIVKNLPNLRKIDLSVNGCAAPTFLTHLIAVEKVVLHKSFLEIDFSTKISLCLKKLIVVRAKINNGIENLINHANFQKLVMIFCDLTLCQVPSKIERSSKLEKLTLHSCKLPVNVLDYIVGSLPQLEVVVFGSYSSICPNVVLKLLANSPKLREVSLIRCPHFKATSDAGYIMQRYYSENRLTEGSRRVRFEIR